MTITEHPAHTATTLARPSQRVVGGGGANSRDPLALLDFLHGYVVEMADALPMGDPHAVAASRWGVVPHSAPPTCTTW